MSYHMVRSNTWPQLTTAVVLLLCFLTVLQLWEIPAVEAKGVHVTVAAPWTETPFLQEGCEWMAVRDINSGGFYECLQDIWRHIGTLNSNNKSIITGGVLTLTQKSQYDMLFDIMEGTKRPSNQVALLKMKLAARVYSPTVEAHWVLARAAIRLVGGCSMEGKPFVMISGKVICNEQEFEKMLKNLSQRNSSDNDGREKNDDVEAETMSLFPKLDHIHPESTGKNDVILYGFVGEEQTMRLFHMVEPYLHVVRLAFRHLPVTGERWKNALFVQGYGVTVDLKNVEYKVMDKKSTETETETEEQEKQSEEERTDAEPVGGFDLHVLKQRYPDLTTQLNNFGHYLAEAVDREEVKVDFHIWESQNMGISAVKQVMNAAADERLSALLNILTNFPIHASKLSKMAAATSGKTDSAIQDAMKQLAEKLPPGFSLAFLNGQRIPTQEIDLFSIMEKLEARDKFLESLTQIFASYLIPSSTTGDGVLTVEPTRMTALLNWITETLPEQFASKGLSSNSPATRVWFPQKNVLWINDIEKDSSYAELPSLLDAVFEMGFGGAPVIPRRNIFNLIVIVDPTTVAGQRAILTSLRLVLQEQPLRLGFVIVDPHWRPELQVSLGDMDDDVATTERSSTSSTIMMIAAVLWELFQEGAAGVREAFQLVSHTAQLLNSGGVIGEADVHMFAGDILSTASKRSLLEIMADQRFNTYYHEMQRIMYDSHFKAFPTTLLNGNIFVGDALTAIRKGVMSELNFIRQMVEEGELKNTDVDMYESIMRSSDAPRRFFWDLYRTEVYVNWASKSIVDFLRYRSFLLPLSNTEELPLLSTVLSVHAPLTTQGLQALLKTTEQLYECKDEMQKCSFIRHTFVICGAVRDAKRRSLVVDLERLLINESGVSESRRLEFMREFLLQVIPKSDEADMNDPEIYEKFLANVHFSYDMERLLADTSLTPATLSHRREQEMLADGFCKQMERSPTSTTDEVDGVKSIYYYANGRRFTYDNEYTAKDLETAALMELPFAQAVWEVIQKAKFEEMNTELRNKQLTNGFYAAKVSSISALFRYHSDFNGVLEEHSLPSAPGPISFVVNPTSGRLPRHRFTIVVDPVSQGSQLLVSLCDYIVHAPIDVSCTVYLNPSQHSGKPMRNFYQYVAGVNVEFDTEGGVVPPAAIFRRLPSKHLLTLGVEEPEGWTVFSMEAQYDLDNVVLASLPHASEYLYAIYRINSILISGSATEAVGSMPPRGLPLMIRSSRNITSGGVTRDTLVMVNLGYFQLQSSPGVWYLTVQPGAIAKSFYISRASGVRMNYIEEHKDDGFNYSGGQSIPIVVSSFTGESMELEVAKAPGEESVQIDNLVKEFTAPMSWPPHGPRKTRPSRPTLNIFSVASGHLYERFLRMMIYSVMRTSSDVHGANTTRIKFWLIENFLSPQFKKLVPLLAEHYGFDVGFVTYRWPWWLNKQTEKQRTIWGYKILFLDVLFPLDVERVIFVDADQTVQADLHELYNMNIGNFPTAYTPFCREHPNKATTNFRFWDQGFWLKHLGGKPYHISAIYLVDVRRLRAIAGGDKYRMMYSQLSRDPNSLANLDQDLPNYLQDQVPIYSLPEEWLWCETWCGAESKARAKTIDLCNNPLTKIPKLENARRIIPNWDEVDAMLEEVSEKLRQEDYGKKQRQLS